MGVSPTQILTPVQVYKRQGVNLTAILYFDLSSFHPTSDSSDNTWYIPPLHHVLQRDFFMFPFISILPPNSESASPIVQSINITKSKTPSRAHLSSVVSFFFLNSSSSSRDLLLVSSSQDFSLAVLPSRFPCVDNSNASHYTGTIGMSNFHTANCIKIGLPKFFIYITIICLVTDSLWLDAEPTSGKFRLER